jgi:hypothetical protein
VCALVQVGSVQCNSMTLYSKQQVSELPLKATEQAVVTQVRVSVNSQEACS